ncbi:phosphoribosyltransferase [Boseongicola aestuarii]|uniref:Putative phosphoribosyl transferase/MT0597 n=1 Tax=Boseongicola aestuarii TaxID=1470561 RepID=A0A238J527_9RHOB|nr:phosphoribosyltransferase family protein [Boseongicola aestuarii]SMX25808.1 Putative phosphoribosyl transferase/MT0597 [Boseongicola aestuarii]
MTFPFRDRRDAGRKLADALPALDPENTVVVALPRGGVSVAEEICRRFHLPLDLVFVRKIGMPHQPEVALGAVVDGDAPEVIVNPRILEYSGFTEDDIAEMGRQLLPEIERRKMLYLQGIRRPTLRAKTVVVVDDGVATGATLRASLTALRRVKPKGIIVALPTAPPETLPMMAELADEVICLDRPRAFRAVGAAYASFPQTQDAEVIAALQRCAQWNNDRDADQ